jgi:hypothetical protein
MNKNIYFSHIPKTAGRTITDIFHKESKRKGKKLYVGEKYFLEIIYKKNHLYIRKVHHVFFQNFQLNFEDI